MRSKSSAVKNAAFFQLIAMLLLALPGCENLPDALKPTSVDRTTYKPVCKPTWKGQDLFIDFDVTRNYWGYRYATQLASDIRAKLEEDIVEDGCFKIVDYRAAKNFKYKVGVFIANPYIKADRDNVISQISADFNIKTYDRKGYLITSKLRNVAYHRPLLAIVSGDSQQKLLSDYAYNVSQTVREQVYASFK